MKVKSNSSGERDIYDVYLDIERVGELKEVYFYVMGRYREDYGGIGLCCIKLFCGAECLDAALDLQEELRAGLKAEREAIYAKAREMLS